MALALVGFHRGREDPARGSGLRRLRDGDRNALSARTFDVPQPGELVGIIVSGQVAVYPAAGGSVA